MDDKVKKLFTGIPFRVGMLFMTFYLVCFSIGAYVFYTNTLVKINQQMDNILAQRHNSIERSFDRNGVKGLMKVVRGTESVEPLEIGVAYQVMDENGKVIAGSITEFEPVTGLYDAQASNLGFGDTDSGFRVYTKTLQNYTNTVALNSNFRDDLLKGYVSSIALTFTVTSILALLGAMLLSYRYNRRFNELALFMEGVGNGNLEQRLAISPKGDMVDRLSEDINNALALLQRQIKGMSQVSSNIAHDLKTPLNRLSIKIEEALGVTNPDQPVYEVLTAASDNATEINNTFEKLLHIAQLDAGARKSKFVFTDLQPLLKKVFDVFQCVAEENKQTLELRSVENLRILGDDDLLLQLIVNLVENAISHNGAGTEILITGGMDKNQPWLSVSDNGVGIPASERELLFDPLYRLEKSRTTKGAGLGLSLVRAVAELHGATIKLTDNKPGLCIKVSFPS